MVERAAALLGLFLGPTDLQLQTPGGRVSHERGIRLQVSNSLVWHKAAPQFELVSRFANILSKACRASLNSCTAAAKRASSSVVGGPTESCAKYASSRCEAACTSRAALTTRSSVRASREMFWSIIVVDRVSPRFCAVGGKTC